MNPNAFSKREAAGQDQWTPQWFIREYERRHEFTYDIDVCACKKSSVAKKYLSVAKCAFKHNWVLPDYTIAFMQPRWKDMLKWTRRCIEQVQTFEGLEVHVLCLAKTETLWFRLLAEHAWSIEFIYPRLNYYDPRIQRIRNGIAFGSAMVCLNKRSAMGWGDDVRISFEEYRKPKEATR